MTDIVRKHMISGNNKECRACLVKIDKKSGCVDLFRPWAPPWSGMGTSIAEDLARLSCIQISECDALSKIICKKCCIRLQDACSLTWTVQNSDIVLRKRLKQCSKTPSWPKPIQVDKNITNTFRKELQERVKQEVMTEDEYDASEYSEPRLDIKIEPEEITPVIIEPMEMTPLIIEPEKMTPAMIGRKATPINFTEERPELHPASIDSEFLDSFLTPHNVKDEPMSEDDSESYAGLPMECMLCMKMYNTMQGLKAHVIAAHSYETVTSPRVERAHVCITCDKSFASQMDLFVHKTSHLPSNQELRCFVCDETFHLYSEFIKHKMDCKSDKTPLEPNTTEDDAKPWPVYYILPNKTNNESEQESPPPAADPKSTPLEGPIPASQMDPTSGSQEDIDSRSLKDANPNSQDELHPGLQNNSRLDPGEDEGSQKDPTTELQDAKSNSFEDPNLHPIQSPEKPESNNRSESSLNSVKTNPSQEDSNTEINKKKKILLEVSNVITDSGLDLGSKCNDKIEVNLQMHISIEESKRPEKKSHLLKTVENKTQQNIENDENASEFIETNLNTQNPQMCQETSPAGLDDTIKYKIEDIRNPVNTLEVADNESVEPKHSNNSRTQPQESVDKIQDDDISIGFECYKINEKVSESNLDEDIPEETSTVINGSEEIGLKNCMTVENRSHYSHTTEDKVFYMNKSENYEPEKAIQHCATEPEVPNPEQNNSHREEIAIEKCNQNLENDEHCLQNTEIEKTGEDGMEIQLEIHSIDKEDAMDIDKELESEIKSSESVMDLDKELESEIKSSESDRL